MFEFILTLILALVMTTLLFPPLYFASRVLLAWVATGWLAVIKDMRDGSDE